MKVEQCTIRKLALSGLQRLDPVTVSLENYVLGQGKIIIECYGQSWSAYWGAMAERSIEQFFGDCDADYLINRLSPGINSQIVNNDALEAYTKTEIIRLRRERDLTLTEARDLYDKAGGISDYDEERELLFAVFGDDWFYRLPQTDNPAYLYLERIVQTVKEGLRLAEKSPNEHGLLSHKKPIPTSEQNTEKVA